MFMDVFQLFCSSTKAIKKYLKETWIMIAHPEWITEIDYLNTMVIHGCHKTTKIKQDKKDVQYLYKGGSVLI